MRSAKEVSRIAGTSPQHGTTGTKDTAQQRAQTKVFHDIVLWLAGCISHAGLTRRVPAWLGQEAMGRMQEGRVPVQSSPAAARTGRCRPAYRSTGTG